MFYAQLTGMVTSGRIRVREREDGGRERGREGEKGRDQETDRDIDRQAKRK